MWNKYWWISSSTLRVHEKCERSFKEISSLFDLFFHKWKDRWYPPTESCIQQNKWGCKNNRGLFSWYGKIIWRGKLVLKRDWATSSAWSGEHRGRASRSIWLCKWREDDLLETLTNSVAKLDEGSHFFVSCSSRFCWSIEVNLRFLS